ncbi:MAG: DUF4168 domain-containing protein [Candidatus Omnitrophica bacterium]|nr:DUF4168 domain-containing protein [Candidatus Omnitrophota bacterium]
MNMYPKPIIAFFFILANIASFSSAYAQEAGVPQAAGEQATIEELKPKDISDSLIDDFLRVDQKIREVQIQANREIFEILEQEKLSVAKYNGIVQAISKDEALLKRVQDRLSSMLSSQKQEEGKQ